MTDHHHHRRSLDEGFSAVQNDLLRMASLLDQAIVDSMKALQGQDQRLAHKVIDGDAVLNRLRYEVEEACLALIATQQPAASDLRAIMALDAIAVELERMADHAEGIAQIVVRMGDESPLQLPADIPHMADICRKMLKEGLDAFIARDASAARTVGAQDDQVDHLYRSIFDELIVVMAHDPSTVARSTYLLWCAHNLERIGDRITNIAERVIFMTTGDIREINL